MEFSTGRVFEQISPRASWFTRLQVPPAAPTVTAPDLERLRQQVKALQDLLAEQG